MAQTRICKVPHAVHSRVMALSEEKGITFAAALEVLLERGEAAISELEARGFRPRSGASVLPISSNPARGYGNPAFSNQGGLRLQIPR